MSLLLAEEDDLLLIQAKEAPTRSLRTGRRAHLPGRKRPTLILDRSGMSRCRRGQSGNFPGEGPRTSVVVGEVAPGITILAVVLTDGSPPPPRQEGSLLSPQRAPFARFL